MQVMTKTLIALGFVGAVAAAIPTETRAQGVYIQAPGIEFGFGAPAYRERYYAPRYGYDRYDNDRSYTYYNDRPYWDEGRRYRSYRRDWD
jgi:hypothetical protein